MISQISLLIMLDVLRFVIFDFLFSLLWRFLKYLVFFYLLNLNFYFKDDKFVFEHPDCLSIFKKALDNIAAKFSSTSTSVRFPNSMSDLPSLNQIAVTGTPVITQQMLNQAFAFALGIF